MSVNFPPLCTNCHVSKVHVESNGFQHPYCSRSCAQQHAQKTKGYAAHHFNSNQATKMCDNCHKKPPYQFGERFCSKYCRDHCHTCKVAEKFFDPQTRTKHDFCSKSCAKGTPKTSYQQPSHTPHPQSSQHLSQVVDHLERNSLPMEFYKADDRNIPYAKQSAFLGNFHLTQTPINLWGLQFRCSEAAYQFAKIKDSPSFLSLPPANRQSITQLFTQANGHDAWALMNNQSRHGDYSGYTRADFKKDNVKVMKEILVEKFKKGTQEARLLDATHSLKLVERTDRDAFWGDGYNRTGENRLGRLLEEIRNNNRKSAQPFQTTATLQHTSKPHSTTTSQASSINYKTVGVAALMVGTAVLATFWDPITQYFLGSDEAK